MKEGEGLDFEALVELPSFAPIRDCIQDATGDELVQHIKDVHPEWDLGFLTNEPPGVEEQEDEEVDVDPSTNKAGQNLPDLTNEG